MDRLIGEGIVQIMRAHTGATVPFKQGHLMMTPQQPGGAQASNTAANNCFHASESFRLTTQCGSAQQARRLPARTT